MDAKRICEKAAELVSGDRADQHGDKWKNMANIARLWSAYLGHHVAPEQVPMMMVLLKVARTKTGAPNPDDYIDISGYGGIGGEIAIK